MRTLRRLPDVTVRPRPVEVEAVEEILPSLQPIAAPAPMRVLDFDIENRPSSYWYGDKTTAEVTAIAWSWVPDDGWIAVVHCEVLTPRLTRRSHQKQMRQMLEHFVEAYDWADMVTGHYIRRHDLPIINAMLVEQGMPLLGEKLAQDTRVDLKKFQDIAKSQEALGAMLGLEWPKEHMTQSDWREANRLSIEGVRETERRVVGDVRQHIELRGALLERDLLRGPKMWRP